MSENPDCVSACCLMLSNQLCGNFWELLGEWLLACRQSESDNARHVATVGRVWLSAGSG